MSDRMILQGNAQNENTLRHKSPTLFSFGAIEYSFYLIFMSCLCMNQIKNTQTFRAPPDYVTDLVPCDPGLFYFAHSDQSSKGLRSLCIWWGHQKVWDYIYMYSGPPLIRPPLGNGKSGLIGGVASREWYFKYNYTESWLHKRGGLWRGWPHIGGPLYMLSC